MLRELRIQNFALIEDLRVSFGSGLNVITGETGSGKSMIIGALTLLLGGRANADDVRRGCEFAAIEALFDAPESGLDGFGLNADDELLISRHIPRVGKGRVYVNGSPSTVTLLSSLGGCLIHLYGQHDQALLLHPDTHLELLDSFGALQPQRERMARAFTELAAARTALRELDARRAHHDEQRALLTFQLDELIAAAVEAGEDERLRLERERLRHAERLQGLCLAAEATLYSDDVAIVTTLARLGSQLGEAAAIDPSLAAPAALLAEAQAEVEEAALALRHLGHHLQSDPNRLALVDERLALVSGLSRKYRVPADELPEKLAALQSEAAMLDNIETEYASAKTTVSVRESAALVEARSLSEARLRAAQALEKQMNAEIETLGMSGAGFQVQCVAPGDGSAATGLDATGFDRIEFLLSANPGEPSKPLARVASGGELSRIMLALKALTARTTETPILIFDEVDAGIGGTVADAVARKLFALSRTHQLLCITHLPQIASYADQHFAVEKRQIGGRTIAQARPLPNAERVHELTRMLGGAVAPSEAERYAQRLLDQGRAEREPRHTRRTARP